jgi:RNA polymerase sigma factor (TIGR02999 family)
MSTVENRTAAEAGSNDDFFTRFPFIPIRRGDRRKPATAVLGPIPRLCRWMLAVHSARVMTPFPGSPDHGELTTLLRGWSEGDADAFERVLPLVYDELHRMAARYLAGERSTVSLQPTALVNELCVRLLGWDTVRWQNREHFFGVSARMMRRVLIDIARRRLTERRGGADAIRIPLDSVDVAAPQPGEDLIAVDAALEQLAAMDARKAEVVELRFFGGLSVEETAAALGVSERTVHSDWAFARAWLYRALSGGHAH